MKASIRGCAVFFPPCILSEPRSYPPKLTFPPSCLRASLIWRPWARGGRTISCPGPPRSPFPIRSRERISGRQTFASRYCKIATLARRFCMSTSVPGLAIRCICRVCRARGPAPVPATPSPRRAPEYLRLSMNETGTLRTSREGKTPHFCAVHEPFRIVRDLMMVPPVRLELTLPCGNQILSLARLPVPPQGPRAARPDISGSWQAVNSALAIAAAVGAC